MGFISKVTNLSIELCVILAFCLHISFSKIEAPYENLTSIEDNWIETVETSNFLREKERNIQIDFRFKKTFKTMRQRWKAYLVGNLDENPKMIDDIMVQQYIYSLSESAITIYDDMNKSANRTILWSREGSAESSLSAQFSNLYVLAIAYSTKGTALYKKSNVLHDILLGLDFLTQEGYYAGTEYFGNWWHWQIGIPKSFISTIMILYDEIQHEKLMEYIRIISIYVPNPIQQLNSLQSKVTHGVIMHNRASTRGANRVETSVSILGLGLLSDNPDKVISAIDSVYNIFDIVNYGTGFYSDYSYLQHDDVPSTGSYGLVLLKGICQILSILVNTFWDLKQDFKDRFSDVVKNAYIPLITNSQMMAMVSGRSISRPINETQGILFDLLFASNFANLEDRQILRQTAKYWIIRNKYHFLQNLRNINDLLAMKTVLEDKSINVKSKPFIGSRVYGAMDRFVYSDNTISLGISMHSNRTSAFESINRENKKGWHTSDGMVYLYNNDQQFGNTFWPTVDWYHLPGTTVDTQILEDEVPFKKFKSLENYVGGVTDKTDAVVSMQLNKYNMYNSRRLMKKILLAKKSWFVFDGKIICLGSDIIGTSEYAIETIVENRLLDPKSNYTFINRKGEDISRNMNTKVKYLDWFLLNSSKVNQNIGYVMLQKQNITLDRVKRSGSYKDINHCFPCNTVYNGTYQKIIITQDDSEKNGKYAYLIYPNATADDLYSFCKQKKLHILSNTADVQAVKDEERNLLGATIWKKEGATIGGITLKQPASFMYKFDNSNQVTLSISDPAQTNVILELELPHVITDIVRRDKGVEVKGKNKITVDTRGAFGKTFQITIKINIVNPYYDFLRNFPL